MTDLFDQILGDIAALGGGLPGYLLEQVRRQLHRAARKTDPEDALDAGYAAMENLYSRVITYQQQLEQLTVPAQEKERYNLLLSAFTAYEVGLNGLMDALADQPDEYETRMLGALVDADWILDGHRRAAQKPVAISAVL